MGSNVVLVAARWWHTVRHLRAVQWYGRLWFLVYRPRPDFRAAPALSPDDAGAWVAPIARRERLQPPDAFRFLGVTRHFPATGWDAPGVPRLWRYHHHYFDWMTDDSLPDAVQVEWVARWVAENRPRGRGIGSTGWEPYPLSLRIVNWVKWHLQSRAGGRAGLPPDALGSLAVQARWLSKRLEYHLLGNHLWANAKALVHAGVLFEGPEADAWLGRGLSLIAREIREQVLADGGHFELSPMYHAVFVEDVLDMLQLAHVFPSRFPLGSIPRLESIASRMLAWLELLTHPDGQPAQFNDCALDEAPSLVALSSYARRCGLVTEGLPAKAATLLNASGYARLERDGAVLIADVGRAGPDYIPGHAHADALSFELSLWGGRVLVNGGTSTYEAGPERLRQRGTPAHNTVSVDGGDSSEVWGGFRLGRRVCDVRSQVDVSDGVAVLEGSITGFQAIGSGIHHSRRWVMEDEGLTIFDLVDGRHTSAEARFHFAPDWDVLSVGGVVTATALTGALEMRAEGGYLSVEPGVWARSFGDDRPIKVACLKFSDRATAVRIRWKPRA